MSFTMRVRAAVYLVIAGCLGATASPRPPPGTEPIPQLMADSSLVCKGEVKSAPDIKFAPAPERFTGIATVHLDHCYKGAPPSSDVSVLFDDTLQAAGSSREVVLRPGDYRLFFLVSERSNYKPAGDFFAVLPISRLSATE